MAAETILVREFCFPQDYAAASQLWQKVGPGVHFGPSDTPAEIEKKLRRDPDLFLVAEREGELVGTVIGGFDGRRGLVYHLAVAEPFQKRGIGRALMDELERRLAAKGCIRCYLLVKRDNESAMLFYENANWQPMDVKVYAKDFSGGEAAA